MSRLAKEVFIALKSGKIRW